MSVVNGNHSGKILSTAIDCSESSGLQVVQLCFNRQQSLLIAKLAGFL